MQRDLDRQTDRQTHAYICTYIRTYVHPGMHAYLEITHFLSCSYTCDANMVSTRAMDLLVQDVPLFVFLFPHSSGVKFSVLIVPNCLTVLKFR